MSDADKFKTIHYRGELVSFCLPSNWVEEYEHAGGGTFYAPGDESLTLRLNVLTIKAPRDLRAGDSGSVLTEIKSLDGGTMGEVGNGQAICVLPPRREHEAGVALDLHTWAVARIVPPRTARVAMFTTTVAVRLADPIAVSDTLAMLLDQIKACIISDAEPVPPPQRPWWKRLTG